MAGLAAAKIVIRMPRPSEPPSCWETLSRPEAAPASRWRDAGDAGRRQRRERDADADAERARSGIAMLREVALPAVSRLSQAMPTTASASPPISSARVAEAADEPRHDAAHREHDGRHGQEREAGLQRAVAAHALQVLREEEEHREHAADHEHARDVRAGALAARRTGAAA